MGACAYPIKNIQDPITVGAHACLQAVIFAEEMDFDNLCSEGDELAILKKLKTQKSNRSITGYLEALPIASFVLLTDGWRGKT
ncbi:hypothetical protein Golob_023396, partial [Gossypium lobatum]|nr:hypothetical protein [Gossypium lobatum]